MGVQLPSEPITRKERYLAKAAGQEVEIPAEPITREEAYLNAIAQGGGGGGGTSNYENLSNQPKINGETLIGDKTGTDLGLVDAVEGKDLSTNDYDDNEKAAVAAATSAISAMKDGTDLDSFGDVEVALLDKADTSDLGTAAAKNSTNAVTAGSTDLVESGAVKDAIDVAVAAAYHHAGTKTVAQLTHDLLVAANEGNVYNITDSGTTTSDFIEGIGKTIDEGSNVGICKVGNAYMFDLLSGFVDTTNFVQKSQTAGLLKNDGTVNDEIEGDVSTLKSGLTNLDNEVNGDAVTYPYADVITINDAVPANLADCSVKVEPVQDLHGYDKPWVGGAGKNKLPYPYASDDGTYSTVSITTDWDGTININGTPIGDIYYTLTGSDFVLPQGEYIISVDNIPDNTRIVVSSTYLDRANKSRTITSNGTTPLNIYLNMNINTGATNISMKPMIRLSTETDATFAPYTNICPISGHTEVSVRRTGENLAFDTISGKNINANGVIINADFDLKVARVTSGVTYTAYTDSSSSVYAFYSDSPASGSASYNNSRTEAIVSNSCFEFTAPIDGYIAYRTNVGYARTECVESSKNNQYTLALGDTIYGGTVDFETGVMTVDRVKFTKNTSTMNNDSPNYPGWKGAGIKQYIGNNVTGASLTNTNVGFGYGYETRYNSDIVDLPLDLYGKTQDEWKALAIDVEFIVELATPTTIQLTPTQIQLLQGANTLTASTGDISVTVNGVSGAIGQVQEQVNELAEDVAEIKPVDYSTTEQDTGEKWTDGKKIYRKVVFITTDSQQAENAYSLGLQLTDVIVRYEALLTASEGNKVNSNYYVSDTDRFVAYIRSDNTINLVCASWAMGQTATVIVYYTKAT